MRKLRLFQRDAYISMDFLERKSEIIRLKESDEGLSNVFPLETSEGTRFLQMEIPEPPAVNAIQTELEAFAESIRTGGPVAVPLTDGLKALELATWIENEIQKQTQKL